MFKDKKILLFGSSGLLGSNFLRYCAKKKIKIVANIHKTKLKKYFNLHHTVNIELSDKKKIIKYLTQNKFIAVLSFIGMTSVEECEKNKSKANLINVNLNKNIVDACRKTDHNFIFISTDHLFSGKKKYYTEKSKENPLNYYAKTKLLIENYIREKNKKFLIIRTNFLAKNHTKKNKGKKSFSDYLISELKNKKKISLWEDVYFNPIYVEILFDIIFKLIKSKKLGTFNVCSNKSISKYSLGMKFAKILNLQFKNILKNKVHKMSSVDRPRSMVLDNKKVRKVLGLKKEIFDNDKQLKLLLKNYT